MDNQNSLLRSISQALQNNQAINEEVLRLLKNTTLAPPSLNELQRLLTVNKSTLSHIKDSVPTD